MATSFQETKEVSDFFEKILLSKKTQIHYEKLRDYTHKASSVVRKYVRKECKDKKLLNFFLKRKDCFIVNDGEVSLKKMYEGNISGESSKSKEASYSNDSNTSEFNENLYTSASKTSNFPISPQENASNENRVAASDLDKDTINYAKITLKYFKDFLMRNQKLYLDDIEFDALPKKIKRYLTTYMKKNIVSFLRYYPHTFYIDGNCVVLKIKVASYNIMNRHEILQTDASKSRKASPSGKIKETNTFNLLGECFLIVQLLALKRIEEEEMFICETVKYFSDIINNYPIDWIEIGELEKSLERAPLKVRLFMKRWYNEDNFIEFFETMQEFEYLIIPPYSLVILSNNFKPLLDNRQKEQNASLRTKQFILNLRKNPRFHENFNDILKGLLSVCSRLQDKINSKMLKSSEIISMFNGNTDEILIKNILMMVTHGLTLKKVELALSYLSHSDKNSGTAISSANYHQLKDKVIEIIRNSASTSFVKYSHLPGILGSMIINNLLDLNLDSLDLIVMLLESNSFSVHNGKIRAHELKRIAKKDTDVITTQANSSDENDITEENADANVNNMNGNTDIMHDSIYFEFNNASPIGTESIN